MHRAALPAHQPVVALHQFAEHLLDRHAARQRVGVAPVGAERQVAGLHRNGKSGCDRLLAERQVARALDQVLQEQIERPLLGLAQLELRAIEAQPHGLADVVIGAVRHGRTNREGGCTEGSLHRFTWTMPGGAAGRRPIRSL